LAVRSPFTLNTFSLEPFARVLWQEATRGSQNEGLATPAALTLPGVTHSGTRVMAGAVLTPANPEALATKFSYRASLAIGSDLGDLARPSVQATLAGAPFSIVSPQVGRPFAQLDLSASYRVSKKAYVYLGVIGEARSNRLDGGVNAGFNYQL
jgi:uncharacterized protein with beta-barrel porin domain